jgi:hypothetical protein
MTEETSYINFEPNDFIIRISPHVDANNEWDGDIDVGMITTDFNSLNEHDYAHLRMLTEMLISAIPLMETDAEFRNKLFKLVNETFNEIDEEPTTPVAERDGNVVKVNF